MNNKYYFLSFLLLTFLSSNFAIAQDYFRIKANFSVKTSNNNGIKNLTKGVVFYDKNIKQLIYDISFPQKEIWLFKDTCLYKIRNDSLIQRNTIPSINEFTIFHLALNSSLNDYGLKNSMYNVNKVEKKGDLVLSYWKISNLAKIMIDHIVVAKKNNKLESVLMIGDKEKILSKQFFRNYVKTGAFEFPQQIVQILYDNAGKENYQVTEFSNIVVNDVTDGKSYQLNLKVL